VTPADDTSEVSTPHGPALVHVHRSERPRGALVLGHGAGGGVGAPDLTAARDVGLEQGVTVVLVEQPYRIAGRRAPAPAKQLDAAWGAVIDALAADQLDGLALIVGGRSMGARVACRTAASSGAIAVLCLAFPLQPPRRSGPRPTRIDELDLLTVPTLVVQGERDPFGMPPGTPRRTVARVPGDHSLRKDIPAVKAAIREWLRVVLGT
jgi:uncharacterized protein